MSLQKSKESEEGKGKFLYKHPKIKKLLRRAAYASGSLAVGFMIGKANQMGYHMQVDNVNQWGIYFTSGVVITNAIESAKIMFGRNNVLGRAVAVGSGMLIAIVERPELSNLFYNEMKELTPLLKMTQEHAHVAGEAVVLGMAASAFYNTGINYLGRKIFTK